MRHVASLLFIVTAVVCTCSAVTAEEKCPKAVNLFNGENLSGWDCFTIDPNAKMEDVWSIQDRL